MSISIVLSTLTRVTMIKYLVRYTEMLKKQGVCSQITAGCKARSKNYTKTLSQISTNSNNSQIQTAMHFKYLPFLRCDEDEKQTFTTPCPYNRIKDSVFHAVAF